jgi:hypothetical protein
MQSEHDSKEGFDSSICIIGSPFCISAVPFVISGQLPDDIMPTIALMVFWITMFAFSAMDDFWLCGW